MRTHDQIVELLAKLECWKDTDLEEQIVAELVEEGPDIIRQLLLRPPLLWFAQQMEIKLAKNDHKGGWDQLSFAAIYDRMIIELQEANEAMHDLSAARFELVYDDSLPAPGKKEYDRVIFELADVANYAMMAADRLQKRKLEECSE